MARLISVANRAWRASLWLKLPYKNTLSPEHCDLSKHGPQTCAGLYAAINTVTGGSAAQSHARINKERAIRRRKLKWLWTRLKEISTMEMDREELLMKLGGARAQAPAAYSIF
jgi:hypothetical protein